MVKGEAHRVQGDRDDARTQFELAQRVASGTPAARQAAVRQARTDLELREYNQALNDLAPVLTGRPAPDVLLPALLLQSEAAYQAGDFMAAGAALRRMLVEFPKDTYEAKERDLLVRHAISRLPQSYRSVVELCDLQHLPLNEAARKLGLTLPAVKSRRHRARQKLRPFVAKLSRIC